MKRLFLLGRLTVFCVATLIGILQSPGQSPRQQDPFESTKKGWGRDPANSWMRTPVTPGNERDPQPAARMARDNYWDNLIGASAPLFEPSAQARQMPIADMKSLPPEVPELGLTRVLMIGKFERYRSFISASARSVYTEIDIRVDRAFAGTGGPYVNENSVVQIERPGGTVNTPWGKVLSYVIRPSEYDFQPGHTYLVLASYHREGDFYTVNDKRGRWDLTTGTAIPDTSIEVIRTRKGLSQLSGLTKAQIEDKLEQLVSKAP